MHTQQKITYIEGRLYGAHEEEHEVEGAVQQDGGQQDLGNTRKKSERCNTK